MVFYVVMTTPELVEVKYCTIGVDKASDNYKAVWTPVAIGNTNCL